MTVEECDKKTSNKKETKKCSSVDSFTISVEYIQTQVYLSLDLLCLCILILNERIELGVLLAIQLIVHLDDPLPVDDTLDAPIRRVAQLRALSSHL